MIFPTDYGSPAQTGGMRRRGHDSEVTIECRDFPACKARPLVIGRTSPRKNKLPKRLTPIPAQKSELLEAAAQKAEELQSSGQRMAISFASLARNDEASTAQDRGDK